MNHKLRLILNFDYKKISGKGVKFRLLKGQSYQTGIRPSKKLELGYITLYMNGMLEIRAGYEWNGANFVFDTISVLRASLFHDALCELYAEGLLNNSHTKMMNDIYRDISKEDGASWIRYKTHRLGLSKRWQGLFS